jgi:hypothetical protein
MSFDRPPESSAPPVKAERPDTLRTAWMEHPLVLERPAKDVGEVISKLQLGDDGVYVRLPLSESAMKGLSRMYVSGVEGGRLREELDEEVVAAVRGK